MDTPAVGTVPARRPRGRALRWLPDVVLSVFIVASPFLPAPVAEFRPTGAVAWVFCLLPLLIVPWRRRWPIGTLAALVVTFGGASVAGTLSPGAGIAVAVAVFHVNVRGPRRRALAVSACAVPAMILLSLPATFGSVFDPRVLQFGLIAAFAAAAGDGARSRREYIAAIMERAERAERTREAEARRRVTEERLRIARDLHDTVAHQIAVINLNAGVASSAIDARPDKARQALTTIRGAARTVLGEIGDLLSVLRSDDEEPTTAPQPGLDRLGDLVDTFRRVGLDVTVRVEGSVEAVDGAPGRAAYRVVQESLTNAHKHGAEHRAHVLVAVGDDAATVVVTNPVPAEAPTADATGSGFGLAGLRERVAAVRGTIEVGPAPGGWKVDARLPLTKERP